MKIDQILTFAVVLFAGSYFGVRSLRAEPAQSGKASVTIPVKGMSCMACVAKTKRTLSGVSGVAEVEVKLDPGSATVKYDPALVAPEKLAGVISGLGYQAGSPTPAKAK